MSAINFDMERYHIVMSLYYLVLPVGGAISHNIKWKRLLALVWYLTKCPSLLVFTFLQQMLTMKLQKMFFIWCDIEHLCLNDRVNRISNNQVSVHLSCISHVVSLVLDQTEVEVFKQEASCCLWQHHRTHLTSGLSNALTNSWNINSTKSHIMPAKNYSQTHMKSSSYAWPADIFNHCMILFRLHWYPQ